MQLLRYLQSRPRAVRAQYAALIAGIATGAIALVWVSTIPSRFAETPVPERKDDSLSELIADTKAQLGNVIGAGDASQANVGENLNRLGGTGAGEPLGAPGTATSSSVGTATAEKRVLIEPAKIAPKTILIGTTTDSE